ncbi:MAG: phosphonate ABC transporter substrate-binding protein [Nanoarchaeota archaeon]|nr:phosphonate ABC transporter substrate-binding protein [DPANN group archaeon]MBL7116662.1 phosphonate ABC transporter substrate-binding protein [Nanoarchaeota archaeon]
MKKIILGLLLMFIVVLAGCQSEVEETKTYGEEEFSVLKMGLIPADDSQEMIRAYEPVKEYLSAALGIPVEILVTSDYTAAIEAMRSEHIDMAWFGPFSYVIASNVAGAEAIVNGVKESTGSATYKSVIVTNVDSGIETLEDLKGKTFAFVDPASTSGNLIPRKILIENGIDPDNDFSTSYYAGTHNAVMYAIANGKVDAGATGDNVYQRMIDAGEIDPEANIIIYESEPIPGSPIVVRGNLPEELKKAIQDALLNMDQQTIHQVDGWGGISKYQKVSDSDYDVIRDTAEILGMDVSTAEAANK